ncbi:MAG: GNAT family N-acetyltransferase, partial [Chitinophagales bacterium]
MEIIIRKAEIADMQAIHGLVQKLAEYEKSPQEVTTTPDTYRADFELDRFDAIVAVSAENDTILGVALYYA